MDADQILRAQHEFFMSGTTLEYSFRRKNLSKLESLIESGENEITQALYADFRKPDFETFISEIQISLDEIRLGLKKLGKWMRPRRVASNLVNFPSSCRLISEPYGVTLIISPWNYPFHLCMIPLAGAVAAGNCAVIKPSEYAPATAAVLENMINNNFPSSYLHVENGDAETAKNLLGQEFDFIFFTGSARVGRLVAETAARRLTPVVLELGGKNPCIVEKDFNVTLAAKRIIWGKFFNGGQTCIAPDYVLVNESIHDDLLHQMKNMIRDFYGEDPETSPDLARIINRGHFQRITGYIKKSVVVEGGKYNPDTLYISPTILDRVSWDDEVMKEEIFGPVLPILTYRDINEVIDRLKQQRDKPLSLYLFTRSKSIREKITRQLRFGGGAVNDTISHYIIPGLPFGGVGSSGYGAYHGKHTFDTFSHKKSILKKGNWLDIPWRYPPYTTKKKNLIRSAFRMNIKM